MVGKTHVLIQDLYAKKHNQMSANHSSIHVSQVIPNHTSDLQLFLPGNKRLRVAVYPNFYPVAYMDGKVLKGLDIDIIKGFCKLAGLTPVFVIQEYLFRSLKMPAIWKDHIDVAVGGIGRTRWRDSETLSAEWTMPYFKVRRTVVYNLKDPIIRFPRDVTGIVAGTMGSTGMEDASNRMHKVNKYHLLRTKTGTDAKDIQDLITGRIQGLMRGSFVGKAIVALHPDKLGMTRPWKAEKNLVGPDGEIFAMPCRRGSGLAAMLNTYLAYLTANRQLAALVKKHGM